MNEREIFDRALELTDEAARSAYLDEACGNNQPLRAHIAGLLQAEQALGGFLQVPTVAVAVENGEMPQQPLPERSGMTIGAYKLIEEIAEGGMGTVWMAQQTRPVKRLVAVKLVKAGMDTKQVIARFEAERQALAIMDHPNIAQVYDGGATASGRPYFVMELVKGVPITQYCDKHRLTPRQRLELFVPVCLAIQHAHQKGIIHRDLKPSNVLVARYDEKPVPKVIDFGVSKATGQPLTEQSLHTGFWAVVGTLEYMSPEQASFNQLDIDTRSDIYSLGILLYELLTGTTPLDHKRAKEAGMLEALRIIREDEAPTASNRLSTTEELASIAARRGLEPAKLRKQVRGELDWIVMKALEKDRNRRYETANEFAADVQRYLSDDPVQACPPSVGYHLRKFARRNKGAVLTVTAIFLLLIAGMSGTSWGLVRAEQARQAEERQRRLAEAAVVSERKAKEAEAQQRARAEQARQKAAREAAIAAAINEFLNTDLLQLSSALGQTTQGISSDDSLQLRTVLQRAAQRIDGKFVNEPEVEMQLRNTIGNALSHVGDYAGALAQLQKVVPYFQKTRGPDHPETLLAEYRLAILHQQLGRKDFLPLLEQNFEKHQAALGLPHAQTLVVMNGLANAYRFAGQREKGTQLAEENLELRKRYLGPDHGDTLVCMNNMSAWYLNQMQLDKALPLCETALAGMQKQFPPLHPETLNASRNLARAYHAAEQIDKAVALQETVVSQFKTVSGIDDWVTQSTIHLLIEFYVDLGWCDKAEALLVSIQSGGANRPNVADQTRVIQNRLDPLFLGVGRGLTATQLQRTRETRYRDLIQRVRPAADKYQQELAAKGAEDPDKLAARQALAVALRGQRRNEAAAYHLQAVLEARQRLLGDEHPDTLASRLELGATRLQQKRYAEAEPLLLAAYAGLKQHETKEPQAKSLATEALQRLVELYDGWDKKDQATEWRQPLDQNPKP